MSTPARQPRLGRGIGSLLIPEDADRSYEAMRPRDVYFGGERDGAPGGGGEQLAPVPGLKLASIATDQIRPNPRQPRRDFDEQAMAELVRSVEENGVLQPIVVRPLPAGESVKYELIMGERRLRATIAAKRRTVPAIIKETADDHLLVEALIENLHRSQLNPVEEASAFQQLIDDFGITHEELGEMLGRSRPSISNAIRLLGLPEHLQRKVAAGVISRGHAKAVLSVGDAALMDRLTDRIIVEELSVREAEAAAVRMAGPVRPKKPQGRRYEQLDEIAERLGSRFDTPVRVDLRAKRGKITIEFGSVADLNRILADIGEDRWEEGEARERLLAERVAALRR